jgi:hypothetical protein
MARRVIFRDIVSSMESDQMLVGEIIKNRNKQTVAKKRVRRERYASIKY